MAAVQRSHGEIRCTTWWPIVLLLVSSRVLPATALRPKTTKRKGHTLDDLLVQNVTQADVEHNDAMRFVKEALEYTATLGLKLSDECETRYGYTFITSQKQHHFRLCKSEAKLDSNGKLIGVSRATSALSRYRKKYDQKRGVRSNNKKRSTSALSAATNTTVVTSTQRRLALQQHEARPQAQARADTDGLQPEQRPDQIAKQHMSLGRRLGSDGSTSHPDSAGRVGTYAQRHLLDTSNGSAGGNSALMYKILKYVAAKKEDEEDDGSDVYNDDDSDNDDDAHAAALEEDNEGATIKNNRGDGDDAKTQTQINTFVHTDSTKRTADSDADEAARIKKRDAWLAKRQNAMRDVIEPDVELPNLSTLNAPFKSSVGCYLHPLMPRHLGFKDAQLMCVGRNVVLDTCALYEGQNEGFEVRFPKPKIGAVKLGCAVRAELLGSRNYTKGFKNRLWWLYAQDNSYDVVRQSCAPGSGRVVEHPVAFVLRDRYTHTLHELEVLSTIFTSLAVADLPEVRQQGIQIIIADQMPNASYRPTYAAISYPYRLRHLAEAPYPPNTCFRTALFINAFTNSIAFNPNTNTSNCFSPIMIGVHRWLRTLHKELDPAYLARAHHHASETGGITRRAVVWTSRRNLEALRLTSGAGMTEWQSARMVPNENQLVTALQSAILQWNARSCLLARYYGGDESLVGCRSSSVQFDLVFGEFSDWPYYPDQLMTIYRTGILIGVHGAALTFITSTTAGESALLELVGYGWEETQTGNMLNLFPSLAHNMGAYYEQVRYQGPDIDIKVATDALVRAMDDVSRRIEARQLAAQQGAPEPHFNDQYNFDVMFPQACPTSVPGKLRRYVTNHPVQLTLNGSGDANTSSANASNSSGGG